MFILSKEQYAEMPEYVQKQYEAKGDGYSLITPNPNSDNFVEKSALDGALTAKNHEKELRKAAEQKLHDYEAKLASESEESARKSGDIESLTKSYEAKIEELNGLREKEVTGLKDYLKSQLVEKVASDIAHDISTAPDLLKLHIERRLGADFDGDTPKTIVKDASGNRSVMTIEDLRKEFSDNASFSAIIKGSKASGGGAGGAGDGKGSNGITKIADFKGDVTAETTFANANPEAYQAMLDAEQ